MGGRDAGRGMTAVADRFFAPMVCALCGGGVGEGGGSAFCGGCRGGLLEASRTRDVCARCGRTRSRAGGARGIEGCRAFEGCPRCVGRSSGFDGVTALGPYRGGIRRACALFKERSHEWLADWLADAFLEGRGGLLGGILEVSARETGRAPLTAWASPHWSRRLWRGHDPAGELARALGGRLGLRVAGLLRRRRRTGKLEGLSRSRRVELLRGAFEARVWASDLVRGRAVLLVDDVMTTGATCGEAARVLKRAGAARVFVAVIGRTEEGRGSS